MITMTCTKCGARIVTRSADEVLKWDKAHEGECVAHSRSTP